MWLAGTLLYTGAGANDAFNNETDVNSGVIDVVNPGGNLTFGSNVGWWNGANAQVAKTGSGALTLGGSGDDSGLYISVQQGTLVLAKNQSGAIGHAVSSIAGVNPGALVQMANIPGGDPNGGGQIYGGAYNMNGTLDFNGMSEGFIGLTGSGTVTNSAGGAATVFTYGACPGGAGGPGDPTNHACTFAGAIVNGNGTIALAVSAFSGGRLTLTGTGNSYSGGTTIAYGELQIGDGQTGPGSLPGNVVVSSTTPGTLTFNTPAGMSLAYSGTISGSGAGGLTKSGSGAVTLTAAETYAGATTISGGTLQLGDGANRTARSRATSSRTTPR